MNVEKFNKPYVGFLAGFLLPLTVGIIVFLSAEGEPNMKAWLLRIKMANIYTHIITLCVLANIIIFMIFNKLDMLKASKGVLAITIIWAFIVFGFKLFA